MFTDTDSLVYENFYENKNLFDFSDYQEDSHFMILSIKKQLVKWKMK